MSVSASIPPVYARELNCRAANSPAGSLSRDIEAAQRGWRPEKCEVIGGQCRGHRHRRQGRAHRQHGLQPLASGHDVLGCAESHPMPGKVAQRSAGRRYRCLVAPGRIEPSAVYARGVAVEVGDGREQRRPDFVPVGAGCLISDSIEATGVKPQRPQIRCDDDTASAQVGLCDSVDERL